MIGSIRIRRIALAFATSLLCSVFHVSSAFAQPCTLIGNQATLTKGDVPGVTTSATARAGVVEFNGIPNDGRFSFDVEASTIRMFNNTSNTNIQWNAGGAVLTVALAGTTVTGITNTVPVGGATANVTFTANSVIFNIPPNSPWNAASGVTATIQATTVCAPTINLAFNPTNVAFSGSTSLSFILGNPNAATGLSAVAFTDTLPAGLVVSTPNGLTNTCGGTVTATPDTGTISLSGATLAAAGSCTLSVNVKGTTTGTKNSTTNATATQSGPGATSNTATLQVSLPVLTVTTAGGGSGTVTSSTGGINCGAICSAGIASGTVVTLTPTPAGGSVFTGWSGDCTGTGACSVTMSAARSVTATFVSNYALTVSKIGNGSGTVTSTPAGLNCGATCNASFAVGASVALAATPSSNSFFKGWTGACTGVGACNVAMSADKSATAEFSLLTNIPRLGNLSTRMQVLTGNDVMIGGFVIGGSTTKRVAIVATGPSLTQYGITNALANPTLSLVRSSDQAVLATSDDWQTAANAAQLTAAGFAPSNTLEAAVLADLAPGAYTAIVQGAGGGIGVSVIGVYEVDHPETPLTNISTRGRVLTGNDVMIGGFVIQGVDPQTVAIVATGPSLAQYGITSPLANPTISLVRSSDQAVIATNDDWQTDANAVQLLSAGFAPSNSFEAGLYVTLPPGAYTTVVSGVGGGTGVAVIGVYKVN